MKIRRVAVAAGLCVTLLTAGCAGSVAGQAEIASGAVVPTSNSAPSPFPDPTIGASTSDPSSDPTRSATTEESTSQESTSKTTESSETTRATENSPTGESSQSEDTSVGPTSVTSVPGLSKDCNAVLAGITAFSKLLQGAGSTDTISQATVDDALEQLPESGLPARPQADITVLRTTVSATAGKTLAQVGAMLTDGTVVDALQDLSSWAQDNCG